MAWDPFDSKRERPAVLLVIGDVELWMALSKLPDLVSNISKSP